MFQNHIDHVDKILERGISELAWENKDLKVFYETTLTDVSKLSELHNMSTSNISDIKNKTNKLKNPVLFARLDNTAGKAATISKKAEEIIGYACESVSLLIDNPNSRETKQYPDYIQSLIVGGFKENILFSLETLNNDLMDTNARFTPIHW